MSKKIKSTKNPQGISLGDVYKELEDELTVDFYKSLLESTYDEIKGLNRIISQLRQNENDFRDTLAGECFAKAYGNKSFSTFKEGALDAYRAADVFMKIKDDEHQTIDDIVEAVRDEITSLVSKYPIDIALGEEIRKMFKPKIEKDETK